VRLLAVSLLVVLTAGAGPPVEYRLLKRVPIPGDGGWDYLTVDEAARRVYVSHSNRVVVLDADTGEVRAMIPGTTGVHGIALAPELGRGFTSNGRANTVTVFDMKTLTPLAEVKTGRNPDAIVFDPASKRVFAFNGNSKNVTVIDAATSRAVATLDLGGQPEFGVADGTGHVFVNLETTDELLMLDSAKPSILKRWQLAPGKAPTGLAIDLQNRRLFVGCGNKRLAVVNADTGTVVATVPIGSGVDATAYDAETRLIFTSNSEGSVTLIRQEGPDKYTAAGTLETRLGAKTLALDPKTHRLFIPAMDVRPAGEAPSDRPSRRLEVLIYGR
jgi:YVTN family beta-propeller protein